MKGVMALVLPAPALPTLPFRLATQVSRHLNVISSARHDAGGFRLQESSWEGKKSQVPATAEIQASKPPNADVQQENTDDIKVRISKVNGAYSMNKPALASYQW